MHNLFMPAKGCCLKEEVIKAKKGGGSIKKTNCDFGLLNLMLIFFSLCNILYQEILTFLFVCFFVFFCSMVSQI